MREYEHTLAETNPALAAKIRAEEDAAASKIQARFRGRSARRQTQAKRETKRQEGHAATKIQARFRGNQERKRFKERKAKWSKRKKYGDITPKMREKLKKIYDELDFNNDGLVDQVELLSACKKVQ